MTDITSEELEESVRDVENNIKPTKEFESPEKLYEELIASVRKYHPSADISLIEKAYKAAREAHEGQIRKSGEPYIIHPLCVGIILAELELDKETIVAGLLHDVLEDTTLAPEEIKEEFGEEVLLLVDGVTKLQHLHLAAIIHPLFLFLNPWVFTLSKQKKCRSTKMPTVTILCLMVVCLS